MSIARKMKVMQGLCAMCPRGTGLQIIAAWGNGLRLCEKHQDLVDERHKHAHTHARELFAEQWRDDEANDG